MRLLQYCTLLVGVILTLSGQAVAGDAKSSQQSSSRITDEVIPLQTDSIPKRPSPLLELGNPFLDTGPIGSGWHLPTDAVWQPSLMVWGNFRTAMQTRDNSEDRVTESSNRFDLYANLYLTPSERFLLGLRPLDKNGSFTRYTVEADADDPTNPLLEEEGDFDDELNANITTLFFEGDFGEIFPFLDPHDRHSLDYGLAVGRQPISFQDGMLIDDNLDAFGISKINAKPSWAVNSRSTLLWAWGEANRNNLDSDDRTANIYGLLNEIDFRETTLEFDALYADGDELTGRGLHWGLGGTQRFGLLNTTFRALGSHGFGEETDHNEEGLLFFSEFSYSPHHSQNFLYLNSFYGVDRFRSASRDPSAGGPLGSVGVLFDAVGLGRYAAPLQDSPDRAFGSALGYQMFFDNTRRQILFEFGGRSTAESVGERALAAGFSVQQAFGRRWVLRVDGFSSYGAKRSSSTDRDRELGFGGRLEWMLRL